MQRRSVIPLYVAIVMLVMAAYLSKGYAGGDTYDQHSSTSYWELLDVLEIVRLNQEHATQSEKYKT